MRRHRITFLAAIICATGCTTHKKEVEVAKRSLYDADFTMVYTAALEATRESYPNIEDAPGRGSIKTAWHSVSYANNSDDMTNPQTLANAQGVRSTPGTAAQASAGMPTRLAYKRYFIRFDISVAGGRPWRLKVVGHAAEWEPGAALPNELHGVARPSWLEGRTDALLYAIYQKIKSYAVPMKDDAPADDVKRTDPAAFGAIPAAAGKQLAALKDVLGARDYAALRGLLAEDVVWSLGGGAGIDGALALWQADPEPLDAMTKALAAGCAGDDKKVMCPAGPPAAGSYQLVLAPRSDGWRITSFVKAE